MPAGCQRSCGEYRLWS